MKSYSISGNLDPEIPNLVYLEFDSPFFYQSFITCIEVVLKRTDEKTIDIDSFE